MTHLNTTEVDSALLDLEGILIALHLIVRSAFNKPGPEGHALAVLSLLATQHAEKLRLAIFPNYASEPEPPCACCKEAAP